MLWEHMVESKRLRDRFHYLTLLFWRLQAFKAGKWRQGFNTFSVNCLETFKTSKKAWWADKPWWVSQLFPVALRGSRLYLCVATSHAWSRAFYGNLSCKSWPTYASGCGRSALTSSWTSSNCNPTKTSRSLEFLCKINHVPVLCCNWGRSKSVCWILDQFKRHLLRSKLEAFCTPTLDL